jgi:hypothetical protein
VSFFCELVFFFLILDVKGECVLCAVTECSAHILQRVFIQAGHFGGTETRDGSAGSRRNFQVISLALTFFIRKSIFLNEVIELVANVAPTGGSVLLGLLFIVRVEDSVNALGLLAVVTVLSTLEALEFILAKKKVLVKGKKILYHIEPGSEDESSIVHMKYIPPKLNCD